VCPDVKIIVRVIVISAHERFSFILIIKDALSELCVCVRVCVCVSDVKTTKIIVRVIVISPAERFSFFA